MTPTAPLVTSATAPLWVRGGAAVIPWLPAGRYRFMNWWCRRPPAGAFWTRAGTAVGRFRFVCDLRDGTAREVCFTGRYEPQETALVAAILRPGATFVDVGANWGYFTLLAAQAVGAGGRVVCLEPDPRLFALLEANVAGNGFANVRAVRVAAAADSGEVRLNGFDPAGGNWGLTRIGGADDGGATFSARTASVDTELDDAGIDRVDLLKMDIEGAEDAALAGMAVGLRAGRYARLLLELHPEYLDARGTSARSVVDMVLAAGYRAWEVRHDPTTTRRAAYESEPDPASLLTPWDPGRPLGPWPHLLFARDRPLPVA